MNLNFTLQNQFGEEVNVSKKYKGKKVVLYFYPKDNTPGCTLQATEFSTLSPEFSNKNAVVIGISKDSVASHEKFYNKKKLSIELLSDVSTDICQLFDVWQLKKFMGKEYMGIVRSTFIFDENHELIKSFTKVRTKGHQEEILNYI